MRAVVSLILALVSAACARGVKATELEVPVEAGLARPFHAATPSRWDFGDGSPSQTGTSVSHAFERPGRYVVQTYEGEELVERLTVLVEPRPVFHAIPVDADRVLAVRTLEELSLAVDFAERLLGGEGTARILDRWPALGFAVDQGTGGGASLDPKEGAAIFTWPHRELEVSQVGVVDAVAAQQAFRGWLLEHGWLAGVEVAGLARFEREDRELDVFVDRGVLYAVAAPLGQREASAQARIAALDPRGLEADSSTAQALDGLAAGGVVVVARPTPGAPWSLLTLAVKVQGEQAWATGRVQAREALWKAPPVHGPRLLTQAPAGPIAVASAALPASTVLTLAGAGPGTPRYRDLQQRLAGQGVDLEAGLACFQGAVDVAAWFDVPGFVRDTIASGGRPQPKVSVLAEAPVQRSPALEPLVAALVREALFGARRQSGEGLSVWRGGWLGHPVEVALSPQALFVRGGAPLGEREAVDLAADLGRRFEGAFGPGHVSLFLDVAQLRRELLQPRLMDDVDPRSALTAQVLAVTLLDRLTQLDSLLLDAAPDAQGAALHAVVTLRR